MRSWVVPVGVYGLVADGVLAPLLEKQKPGKGTVHTKTGFEEPMSPPNDRSTVTLAHCPIEFWNEQ